MTISPTSSPTVPGPGPLFNQVLVFLSMATMLGAIIQGAAPKLLMRKLPQPVILMTLFVFGGVAFGTQPFSTELVRTIDPIAIQALFLPPLMFAELFRMNIQNFRVVFWQLVWLVGPGVVIGAALTALFPWIIMPSTPKFSFYLSVAFGGMLSTTDPIAVIMTVNELGAPRRLAAIVGGESLLNDGVSIVIVTLFLELAAGGPLEPGAVVFFAINNICLSVLFGFVCGMLTLIVMRFMRDDGNTMTAITLASPYLTYTISSYYFSSSGVLALVPLGILLNRFGRGLIRGGHLEAMEEYWETLSFLATTWLYALTGFIVGVDFLSPQFTQVDWGSLFVLYLWITLVRLVVVAVSMPILYRFGYGFSLREGAVLWWGGLRGAVGLTLSISIRQNHTVPDRAGLLTTFFMAGTVLIMLINVITLPFILRKLNLHQKPNEHVLSALQAKMYETGYRKLRATGVGRKTASELFRLDELATQMLPGSSVRSRRAFTTAGTRSFKSLTVDDDMTVHPLTSKWVSKKLMNDKRRGLLRNQLHTYNSLLARGLLSRAAWYLLILAVEKQIDSEESELDQWRVLVRRAKSIVSFEAPCMRKEETTARVLLDALASGELDKEELKSKISAEEKNRGYSAEEVLPSFNVKKNVVDVAEEREMRRLWMKYFNCYDEEYFVRRRMVDVGLSYSRQGWVNNYVIAAWAFIVAQQRSKTLIHRMFQMDRTSVAFAEEQFALQVEVDRTCRLPALFIEAVADFMPEVSLEVKRMHAVADTRNTLYSFIGQLNQEGLLERMEIKRLTKLADKAILAVQEIDFELKQPVNVGLEGKRLKESPNFYPFVPIPEDELLDGLEGLVLTRSRRDFGGFGLHRVSSGVEEDDMAVWSEQTKQMRRRWSDSTFDAKNHCLIGVEAVVEQVEGEVFDSGMFENEIDLKRF
jgi:NhaP-type Na+/H+ or K+/H+ antiporter